MKLDLKVGLIDICPFTDLPCELHYRECIFVRCPKYGSNFY